MYNPPSRIDSKFDLPNVTFTAETVTLKTGTGADDIGVGATATGATVSVNAGLGNDRVTVGSAGRLSRVRSLKVDGEGDADTVTLDDSADDLPRTFTIDDGSVVMADLAGTRLGSVGYRGTETLTLTAGTKSDSVVVRSTPTASVTINGGFGTDALTGRNAPNLWVMAGFGSGKLNGNLTFKDFQRLNGGTGIDTLDYSGYTKAVTVDLAAGTATDLTAAGNLGFENVTGGKGDDTLTGNGLDNLLRGGDGNDTLVGGVGNDILVGDAGDDLLDGEAGLDILIGGVGRDKLVGWTGDDILVGGSVNFGPVPTDAALAAILAEWTSGRPYLSRVENIRGSGWGNGTGTDFDNRKNGGVFLTLKWDGTNPPTVVQDTELDGLLGSQLVVPGETNSDWFFATSIDLRDAEATEKID